MQTSFNRVRRGCGRQAGASARVLADRRRRRRGPDPSTKSNLRRIKSCPSPTTRTNADNLRYYEVYCVPKDDRILIFDFLTANMFSGFPRLIPALNHPPAAPPVAV